MTTDDQIKDEKLQYNINREAAKISALSSGKIDKYEYLTGEEILPSNQQQIIEQVKFTYSPLGKAFEKQIKAIEDQGEKQVKAWQGFKSKAIEGKSNNNKSKASIIFNDLINERKKVMDELYDSVNYKNLKFEYVTLDKNISFYKNMNSKKHFNKIKSNQISYDETLKEQKLFLKALNEAKIRGKNNEQKKKKKKLIILKIFINLEKKFLIFLKTILK